MFLLITCHKRCSRTVDERQDGDDDSDKAPDKDHVTQDQAQVTWRSAPL